MMHFAVVEFSEDRSVEVVPSNWIVDDVCFWPPFRGLRFTAAAKKCETPADSWLKFHIRVIRTYGWSYLNAFVFKTNNNIAEELSF